MELGPGVGGYGALEGPTAGVDPLVGRVGVKGVLGLVPAHWWVKLGSGVCGCRALGVLDLVLAHW